MDIKEAERALRLAALGRKKYYGTHSFWSGLLAAFYLSIFQTATRHGLNPEAAYYLDSCMAGGPPPALEQFLFWNIPEEAVKKYSLRTEEGSP